MCNHDWKVIKHNEEHFTIKCDVCSSKFNGYNHFSVCSYKLRNIGNIILAFLLGFAISVWLDIITIAAK